MFTIDNVQILEIIERIGQKNDKALQNIFLKLGLNRWAYQNTAVDTSVETNYPDEWKEHYISNNYFDIDPVALAAKDLESPYIWSLDPELMTIETTENLSENVRLRSQLSNTQSKQVQEAADFKLNTGILIPINDSDNDASYAFSPTDIELDDLRSWGRSYFHILEVICNIDYQLNKPKNNNLIEVTPKEREVLKWLADGKSSWEIGRILNISERTANFHIGNIKKKLQASNRSQIIASAFRLNLIK